MDFFTVLGFTLLMLYIHYLQTGCIPPVVPPLQNDYPAYFSNTVPISKIIDQLKSKELPEELKNFESTNKQTLGELFVGFFRFYASFDWSKVVSITRSRAYVSNNRPLMKIEDPYELGDNCARGIYERYSFNQIKMAFSNALRKLDRNMDLDSVL